MRIALFVLDVPVKIAIKDFWTKFPMGLIVKPFGGLGINRRPKVPGEARKSQVEQLANFFNTYSKIALIVAPEGSRSLRTEWKKGFYYTAKMANVPICYGFLDYAKKEAGVGGVIYPTDDLEADMKQIMAFYRNIQGKYPEKFSIDERYGALAKGNS
jgi:1-acyl-sn-glycerol-3-phosphate acyltransferase